MEGTTDMPSYNVNDIHIMLGEYIQTQKTTFFMILRLWDVQIKANLDRKGLVVTCSNPSWEKSSDYKGEIFEENRNIETGLDDFWTFIYIQKILM